MERCKECGHIIEDITHAMEKFILSMKRPAPRGKQSLYLGKDGKYYVTYSGGEVSKSVAGEAIRLGVVKQEYEGTHGSWVLS